MAASKPNVAELVARMPEVDKPKPDAEVKPGQVGKFTGPNPAEAEKIFAELFAGGRDRLLELAALIKAPGDEGFESYKAAYLLHGLALYTGKSGHESLRTMLARALAAQLADDKHSKPAKAFFLQELQVCGGPEVIPALARLVGDEELGDPALRALLSIRPGAAEALRAQFTEAKGRNRIGVIHALGRLGDAAAVGLLKNLLNDDEGGVRLAAAWSLATLADSGSADALLNLANGATGWARVQADKNCLLLAENLAAAGKKAEAKRIYGRLRDARQEASDERIRAAAELGLKALE